MIVSGNLTAKEFENKLSVEIVQEDMQHISIEQIKKKFSVQYNPENFAYSRSVDLQENEKKSAAPTVQFNISNKRALKLTLIFDAATYPGGGIVNVKQITQPFELLTQPLVKKTPESKGRPPYINLLWADDSLRGFVKSFTQQFTLFNKEGIPQRAKVTLDFLEYVEPSQQAKEEGSGDPEHYYTVQHGDTLQIIAHRILGKQEYWREIAKFNNMNTFRDLEAGSRLMIPAINN